MAASDSRPVAQKLAAAALQSEVSLCLARMAADQCAKPGGGVEKGVGEGEKKTCGGDRTRLPPRCKKEKVLRDRKSVV